MSLQSHWESKGHRRANCFPNWFNPVHLEFHDPSNQTKVRSRQRDTLTKRLTFTTAVITVLDGAAMRGNTHTRRRGNIVSILALDTWRR